MVPNWVGLPLHLSRNKVTEYKQLWCFLTQRFWGLQYWTLISLNYTLCKYRCSGRRIAEMPGNKHKHKTTPPVWCFTNIMICWSKTQEIERSDIQRADCEAYTPHEVLRIYSLSKTTGLNKILCWDEMVTESAGGLICSLANTPRVWCCEWMMNVCVIGRQVHSQPILSNS